LKIKKVKYAKGRPRVKLRRVREGRMARRRIKHREGISQKSKKPRKTRKPVVDILRLREAVSMIEPGKSVQESPDGSRKKEPAVQVAPPGRRCICCDATLSIYNMDKLCWPCDKAIAEWKNFSLNRFEIEKRMESHCLRYVRENCSGRKKASGAVGGEVSSGSFARAVGRKQTERK
jgi:hypothetical protein